MNLLNRRRTLIANVLTQSDQSPYVFVEYLESTGTQRISTDFYLKSEHDVEFRYWIEDLANTFNKRTALWSSNNLGLDAKWHYHFNYGSEARTDKTYGWKYYANSFADITTNLLPQKEIHTVFTKGDMWYHTSRGGFGNNGINKMTADKKSPIPLQMFGAWLSATNKIEPVDFTNVRFYYFKVTEGGTTVAYFRPCYRKADGVAGMYDLVNDVFYTNVGTGKFIIGGEV